MQEQERPQAGSLLKSYLKTHPTGEIPRQSRKTKDTALLPPTVKLPTDGHGRAYLAVSIRPDEPISDAITLAVTHFSEVQLCYPVLIELDTQHYQTFGAHFRRFYPDASTTGIPIVPAKRDRYAVICLGEARRH